MVSPMRLPMPSFLILTLTLTLATLGTSQKFAVEGHITHGINSFNSKPMVDFSGASKIFTSLGPVHEVGVKDVGGKNGSRITSSTPLSTRMATIDAYNLRTSFGLARGRGKLNVPLAQTPTIFFGSQTINDRVKPASFAMSSDPYAVGRPYLSEAADADIRLSEWNSASAVISGRCEGGGASVTVRLRNGLPNALYTMLDIGVNDALTDKEAVYVSAFGGLPNVMATDVYGNGKVWRRLKYCPLDKCEGSKRCTLYVSLFYHFDHMIYGASPAIDSAGPAIGNVGSNQIHMFFNGKTLVPPQNRFWK